MIVCPGFASLTSAVLTISMSGVRGTLVVVELLELDEVLLDLLVVVELDELVGIVEVVVELVVDEVLLDELLLEPGAQWIVVMSQLFGPLGSAAEATSAVFMIDSQAASVRVTTTWMTGNDAPAARPSGRVHSTTEPLSWQVHPVPLADTKVVSGGNESLTKKPPGSSPSPTLDTVRK